jgi:hypothetical protein
MWTIFFIISLFASVFLLVYILIELNEFEKKINILAEDIQKHYENE